LSRKIVVVDSNGVRSIPDENLPLNIGSQTTAHIRIPGSVAGGTGASIDLLEGRPFLQRGGGGGEVTVNGEVVTANRWLIDGDTIAVGGLLDATACVAVNGGATTISVAWEGYQSLSNPTSDSCGAGLGKYGTDDAKRQVLTMTTFITEQ